MPHESKPDGRILKYFNPLLERAQRMLDDSPALERLSEAVKKRTARNADLHKTVDPMRRLIVSHARGSYRAADRRELALALACLLYVQSPVDAIPDWLPGGLRDDERVASWVAARISGALSEYQRWEDALGQVPAVKHATGDEPATGTQDLTSLSVEVIDPVDSMLLTRVDLPAPHHAPPIALNGAAMVAAGFDAAIRAGQMMRVIGPESLLAGLNSGSLELVHSAAGNLGTVRGVTDKRFAGQLRFGDKGESAPATQALAAFQLASAVTLQYYLARIDRQLGEIVAAVSALKQIENDNRYGTIEAAHLRCQTVEKVLAKTGAVGHHDRSALRQAHQDLEQVHSTLMRSVAARCTDVEAADLKTIGKRDFGKMLDTASSSFLADVELLLFASVVRHRIHGVQTHLFAEEGPARVEIAIAEQRDSEEAAIAALIRCREALAKLNVSKRSLDARWGAVGGPEQALSTYSAMATPTLSRLAQPRAVLPRFTPEEPFLLEMRADENGEVVMQWATLRDPAKPAPSVASSPL